MDRPYTVEGGSTPGSKNDRPDLRKAVSRDATASGERVGYEDKEAEHMSEASSWQPEASNELSAAILRLERDLPGWWWSVGSCPISSHATIGPAPGSRGDWLDDGTFDYFNRDLLRPSTAGQALNACINDALAALPVLEAKR